MLIKNKRIFYRVLWKGVVLGERNTLKQAKEFIKDRLNTWAELTAHSKTLTLLKKEDLEIRKYGYVELIKDDYKFYSVTDYKTKVTTTYNEALKKIATSYPANVGPNYSNKIAVLAKMRAEESKQKEKCDGCFSCR